MVYLGAQSEYPWPGGRGFLVEPGHETSVRLSATKVTADRAEIGSIPPRLRGCYFPEEVELRAHGNYTMTNCLYECTVEAVNRCKINLELLIPDMFMFQSYFTHLSYALCCCCCRYFLLPFILQYYLQADAIYLQRDLPSLVLRPP